MIAWTDVETTGLEPRDGALLEVGVILTDDQLDEIARLAVLLEPPLNVRKLLRPEVVAIHDAGEGNNLLADCEFHGISHSIAETELCAWLTHHGAERPVMAGSSVHFDRAWLRAKLPVLEAKFHYRSIDVSSFKELNARWHFAPEWAKGRKLHRALPDIEDSIAELRHYRAALGA